MSKIKIVWICHFTDEEVQSIIPLWKRINEFASWIPNMVKGFENSEEVELHIISPHEYLKHKVSLKIRNVYYHFIPIGIPVWHRHWPGFLKLDVYTNFHFFRKKTTKIVRRINPDLINLIGVENAYYSSSIFNLGKQYPILITIQGFVSQLRDLLDMSPELKKRIKVEEKILSRFKYYCGEQDSSTYISTYNTNHLFFRFYFPVNELLAEQVNVIEKKFDCIYFGRLSKIKGTEDFIRVIAEIKKIKPDVSACIVGGGDARTYIKLAKELNCKSNIEFVRFTKSQKELFEYVKLSKVFLAPPYRERLSSTIREAMMLKIPIVAYATGGIPYINEHEEHVYLVKTGDYEGMARKALMLLDDDQRRNDLAEMAYKYCLNEYSLNVNINRLISAYNTILENEKEN